MCTRRLAAASLSMVAACCSANRDGASIAVDRAVGQELEPAATGEIVDQASADQASADGGEGEGGDGEGGDGPRPHVYFGKYDLSEVFEPQACASDTPPASCATADEAATVAATLLVLPAVGGKLPELTTVGDEQCVPEDYAATLADICERKHKRPLCMPDAINSKLSAEVGLLVGGKRDKETCSGVVWTPRSIATAAHCFKSREHVAGYIVAGYVHAAARSGKRICFPRERVYRLGRVVAFSGRDALDYAVVEVQVSKGQALLPAVPHCLADARTGDRVYTRGHPFGFPQFYADEALVLDAHPDRGAPPIETTLDAFTGNSGSPVFRADKHCVVGLITDELAPLPNGPCCGFESITPDSQLNTKVTVVDDGGGPSSKE